MAMVRDKVDPRRRPDPPASRGRAGSQASQRPCRTQHAATATDIRPCVLEPSNTTGASPAPSWRNIRLACMVRGCPIMPPSPALPSFASKPMPAAPWRKQATTPRAKQFGSHGQSTGKNSRSGLWSVCWSLLGPRTRLRRAAHHRQIVAGLPDLPRRQAPQKKDCSGVARSGP